MPRAATKKSADLVSALQDSLLDEVPAGPDGDDQLDDLFAPLEDDGPEYYNMCFYGREGGGKSSALASAANAAPEGSKILIVNAEGGLKVRALQRLGIDTSKIVVYPKKGEELTRAGLDRMYRRVQADLRKDPNSWFCIGWDSVTEVHNKILDKVATSRVDKARDRGVTITEEDEFFTDRSDYGTMSKMVNDLLRKFRDLPTHFVVTALERRDVDEKTAKVTYGPAVTPGLMTALLGYTDINLVFRAEDEDGPYRAASKGVSTYRLKDRVGSMPKVLAQPTFERILGYADGTLNEEEDLIQATLPVKKAPIARSGKKTRPARGKQAEAPAEADTDNSTTEEEE